MTGFPAAPATMRSGVTMRFRWPGARKTTICWWPARVRIVWTVAAFLQPPVPVHSSIHFLTFSLPSFFINAIKPVAKLDQSSHKNPLFW